MLIMKNDKMSKDPQVGPTGLGNEPKRSLMLGDGKEVC